ncbi:phosphoribosylformylglycinamidine cyclo-ligase [Legionella taurinensis]|uniref:Phosphoribosylformylglycinamidine cyclo-ligase n=1 Tax=Legionella taurinensis TaxID=70611 RepID=A0A3A5L427_9GAMM|nr:phosphoribosylformylglycinamidine cyclo-ligase [Legionella taurinensis]MDX1837563.1 phosphoribosylformylglycinamidine cyclo-ligase [Legionella taurinensis]PUT40895.1 phosphoribosylformylglycinamidine cyclo-ligase [Legionella taurinensis]PUT41650.1 phosphoribosylformylglycinamidine cyclo-ligase [Legionella taurinensis]PUT44317.1 phosphoribosylformylglycinamidine cyclo-ligase [Legionella taurinensis]PUT48758.1 phosphoribosylformylglycinamidine cyclo-ligase [Legionella taurinensis]
MTSIDYKAAGVDVEAGNRAVRSIKAAVESTFSPRVLTGIGHFASMFDLKPLLEEYEHPVMVQSIDGVGTKMMVAKRMQKFDTIGMDLVSATTNDIIVLGAKPLTLLDYIANDKLDPAIVEQIVSGMVVACRENQISLVGGETAEMPGTYLPGEFDLVGVITGVVDKHKAITGKTICEGDSVVTFPSSGLHTNGYSLARKLFFGVLGLDVDSYHHDLGRTIGEELLTPHLNYTQPVHRILAQGLTIKGMAHITGGGLLENIPRILPPDCGVEIEKKRIPHLPVFDVMKQLSRLDDEQMFRTFNMGAGLVLILSPQDVSAVRDVLQKSYSLPVYEIGKVVRGPQQVTLL